MTTASDKRRAELLAELAELGSSEPTVRERAEAAVKAAGQTPKVTSVDLPPCSWTVKADDPIDGIITSAQESERAWSKGRMENLQYVADLESGATCGYPCPTIRVGYEPLCPIHLTMARKRRQLAWDNSASKLRGAENESVFQAALGSANRAKTAGGDVLISNTSFGQYLVRKHDATWDDVHAGMIRFTVPKGREAFIKAVRAASFDAGKAPVVVEA